MATQANISFYKGEDVVLTVTMSPATNISGWTLQFTLRKQYGDTTALVTKTIGSGITQVIRTPLRRGGVTYFLGGIGGPSIKMVVGPRGAILVTCEAP